MATIKDIHQLCIDNDIPVKSVRIVADKVTVVLEETATKEQKSLADQLVIDNPISKPADQILSEELAKQHITDHDMLLALWCKIMDQEPVKAEQIQQVISGILQTNNPA